MSSALPSIDEMPRKNASQVKSMWGDVCRAVRQAGSVAVTNRSAVEMVLVDAAVYREMTEKIHELEIREQARLEQTLNALSDRFDARLAVLNQPDAQTKLQELLDADGQNFNRPIAGKTY